RKAPNDFLGGRKWAFMLLFAILRIRPLQIGLERIVTIVCEATTTTGTATDAGAGVTAWCGGSSGETVLEKYALSARKNGRQCPGCGKRGGRHTLSCPNFKEGGGFRAGGHLDKVQGMRSSV